MIPEFMVLPAQESSSLHKQMKNEQQIAIRTMKNKLRVLF
jgi:hypothetical protein